MILENGYPKSSLLATDLKDSPRFAGLLQLFGWPGFVIPDYINDDFKFVRSPCDDPKDFSRDQALVLFAGYTRCPWMSPGLRTHMSMQSVLDAGIFPNGDLMHPGHKGHIKRCMGQKSSLYEKAWLVSDIWFQDATNYWEMNQILSMAVVAGPWYVKKWAKWLPAWRESLRSYWVPRGEIEFVEFVIKKVEEIVK